MFAYLIVREIKETEIRQTCKMAQSPNMVKVQKLLAFANYNFPMFAANRNSSIHIGPAKILINEQCCHQ